MEQLYDALIVMAVGGVLFFCINKIGAWIRGEK